MGVLVRLKAGSSGGIGVYANNWTQIAQLGAGGSAAASFYGFAGYNSNQGSSYTTRSFTDKNFVDSSRALDVQLAGTQTITGAKTFSAIITASSRINISGATDNASYPLNVVGNGQFTGTTIHGGLATAAHTSLTGDQLAAWGSGGTTPSLLYLNHSGGDISMLGNKVYMTASNGDVTLTDNLYAKNGFFNAGLNLTPKTGTNSIFQTYSNTGGNFYIGIDNSTGSNLGNGAYAANFYTDAQKMVFSTANVARMTIAASGDVSVANLGTGTVYSNSGILTNTNPSDSTIKNTIKPLGYGLSDILKLQPKTFYYNSDSAKTSLKYGFIAQEVQKIMPDMVRKFNVSTKVNGKPATIEKLGLETDGIYVTLVKAIQEQQAIIDDLKKRIIALENK